MTKDYALGYYQAMELAIQFGRELEGDCGDVEHKIINDPAYQEAEDIYWGNSKPQEDDHD